MASLGQVVIEIAANSAQFRSEIERTRSELVRLSGSPVENTRAGLAKVKTETEATGRGLAQVTQAARIMTGQLITEMSPALGTIVTVTATAARGFQSYSVALASIGVGATAAIAVITQLARATLEASKNQAELNLAIATFDTATLESKLKGAALAFETFKENAKSPLGSLLNTLQEIARWFNLIPDFTEEAQKARAGITQTAPVEMARVLAEASLKESAARKAFTETILSEAELQNNVQLYDRMTQALRDLINLELEATLTIARTKAKVATAQKEALGLTPETIAADLATAESVARTAAQTQQRLLQQRSEAGRLGILQRRRDIQSPLFETPLGEPLAAPPEMLQALQAARQAPWEQYLRSMNQLDDVATNLGQHFDKTGAEINATTRALEEFGRQGVGPADERVAQLQGRLTMLSTVRELFTSVGSAVSQTISGVIQGTQTVQQAFAHMGQNIAAGLIDSVINKGLKVLEAALIKFIDDVQKSGLIQALVGIGIKVGGVAASAAAPTATPSYAFETGVQGLQHGGIVTRPMLAMVAESGPEAVVPLNQLAGGHGPMVEVNVINQAPGTTAESRERTVDGRRIHDIVIREIRQGAAMGELDSMFGSFGGRRVATQR